MHHFLPTDTCVAVTAVSHSALLRPPPARTSHAPARVSVSCIPRSAAVCLSSRLHAFCRAGRPTVSPGDAAPPPPGLSPRGIRTSRLCSSGRCKWVVVVFVCILRLKRKSSVFSCVEPLGRSVPGSHAEMLAAERRRTEFPCSVHLVLGTEGGWSRSPGVSELRGPRDPPPSRPWTPRKGQRSGQRNELCEAAAGATSRVVLGGSSPALCLGNSKHSF